MEYDVIVIGAGPGGYVAAIRAAQLKLKVLLFEKEHLGGVCLNWGCIPTKSLLKSAEVYNKILHAAEFGISVQKPAFKLQDIVKRSRDVSAQLAGGVEHLMKKNGVEVVMKNALVKSANSVTDCDGKEYKAKNIIVATGARARELPNIPIDGKSVLSYKEAMVLTTMPKKLLVVGSGAIGIEFANFFNLLGADVTVAEIADRIMPVEDKEIGKKAQDAFVARGMKFKLSTEVKEIAKKGKSVEVLFSDGKKEQYDKVISAVGIVANTEGIFDPSLSAKIKMEKGLIMTDDCMQTSVKGIYAIGDITRAPWLAHKASHEGVIAAEHIAGLRTHSIEAIPGCTYSVPQVASIGKTEEQAVEAAKKDGFKLKVGRFSGVGNGKAIASGETETFVKTIFREDTGELLGAHMIGADVTEMISLFALGKTLESTEAEFMNTVFPHPTISEMVHESVLDAYDRALHC